MMAGTKHVRKYLTRLVIEMYDDLAFPDPNPWVREELTLENTSILLVNTLRFLINEFGFAGVEHTLNLMRNNA